MESLYHVLLLWISKVTWQAWDKLERIYSLFKGLDSVYRVIHLVVHNGWVDFDLDVSAKLLLSQAKLGWQWNNRSQQNLVIDHPSHPIYLSGKMYEGQDVDIWGAKSLLRWWTSSCAEQVTFAPAASETLQVYWPLSSAEQVGSSRVKWFSFATICRVMVFLHDFSTNNLSTLFWMFSVFIVIISHFELWQLTLSFSSSTAETGSLVSVIYPPNIKLVWQRIEIKTELS